MKNKRGHYKGRYFCLIIEASHAASVSRSEEPELSDNLARQPSRRGRGGGTTSRTSIQRGRRSSSRRGRGRSRIAHGDRGDIPQDDNSADSFTVALAKDSSQPQMQTSESRRAGLKRLRNLRAGDHLIAPDDTVWKVVDVGQASAGRRPEQNILREAPGPTGYAKRHIMAGEALSAWHLMIDDFILKNIKKYTEQEARRVLGDEQWTLEPSELLAFIGVLCVRGATGAKGLPLPSLWSEEWGVAFFKNAISRNRFQEIMRFLRFDDKTTRSERLKQDKFALFSEIWYRFIGNAQSCYKPGAHLTIDEQLFPSKARCPFTQFMQSKPDKYGQKNWMAVDNDSKYVINAFPYLGKDETRPSDQRLADQVVLKLVEPFLGKGRNVTCDNFFTSTLVAEDLRKKKN